MSGGHVCIQKMFKFTFELTKHTKICNAEIREVKRIKIEFLHKNVQDFVKQEIIRENFLN